MALRFSSISRCIATVCGFLSVTVIASHATNFQATDFNQKLEYGIDEKEVSETDQEQESGTFSTFYEFFYDETYYEYFKYLLSHYKISAFARPFGISLLSTLFIFVFYQLWNLALEFQDQKISIIIKSVTVDDPTDMQPEPLSSRVTYISGFPVTEV